VKIVLTPARDHKQRYLGFISITVYDEQGKVVAEQTMSTPDDGQRSYDDDTDTLIIEYNKGVQP